MDRRFFLKSLAAAAGALGAGALAPREAHALPAPVDAPPRETVQPALAMPDDVEEARIENVHWQIGRAHV